MFLGTARKAIAIYLGRKSQSDCQLIFLYTGLISFNIWKHVKNVKKLRIPLPRGSSLCEGMGEGYCTQPYPCICKEAVSGFEPMTNKSLRHNFTAAPGQLISFLKLAISLIQDIKSIMVTCIVKLYTFMFVL